MATDHPNFGEAGLYEFTTGATYTRFEGGERKIYNAMNEAGERGRTRIVLEEHEVGDGTSLTSDKVRYIAESEEALNKISCALKTAQPQQRKRSVQQMQLRKEKPKR